MDGGQKYIPREKLQALTTQITYQGVCGIPSAPFYKGDTYAFKFTVDCPLALCNLPTGKAVDHGAENQFLQSVMAVYNEEIFSARRWICQVCGKPAKVLYHGMVPFLCSELGPSSDFQPSVWDSVVPICTTAGECDFQAEEVAKQSFRDVLPKAITCSQYGCESCGIVKNVKRCAGCKRIWYCSRACQSSDWPKHKRACRHAQKERADNKRNNRITLSCL
ncbi:uncharacterized protein BDCG_09439 [Blastomyces dermatitidis ER-3]|uniref:MYND-type domain-containing protein n=5 Tax=Blastomyces TaxID=229219 RepID=A0A179V4I4_BLAGS|nr:uncharacterized protein BDBG_08704 [Blastomyces gilchristii SLH14081]XP_045282938.1 uncharacterized protein BDCG_09439 [Blastomyces dermatitidis ER-3]OAT03211.1 hypothetical protein BDCG_09439 [Blastomyces dermatitidis ER-3]OAT13512.1 hypothetical protein BDBG_08704 [Blastomyces gilchristii SLH14081]